MSIFAEIQQALPKDLVDMIVQYDRLFLISAVKSGNIDIARFALDHSRPSKLTLCIASSRACSHGYIDILKLLSRCEEVQKRISDGSLLRAGARNGQLDIVKYLIFLGSEFSPQSCFPINFSTPEHKSVVDYLDQLLWIKSKVYY
jgi:hypothetical protein